MCNELVHPNGKNCLAELQWKAPQSTRGLETALHQPKCLLVTKLVCHVNQLIQSGCEFIKPSTTCSVVQFRGLLCENLADRTVLGSNLQPREL